MDGSFTLAEISATKKDTGLCVAGWHQYHDPKRDKNPYAYALKIMTTNPSVYLWVKLPITPELKLKFKELKEKCIASTYKMVEVTFDNFEPESHFVKWTDKGFETLRYKARATNFHFVED